MQLTCLIKSGISPGDMQQVFSWGGYQSILNPAVLRLWKIGYCPMIEGYGTDFTTVYIVFKHAQMVGDVWNWTMQESSLKWPSYPRKANSNEVYRRIFKQGGSSWKITHRTEIPVYAGWEVSFFSIGFSKYFSLWFNDIYYNFLVIFG